MKMNLLDSYILNYDLISKYDIELLKDKLCLPIKKDEYFTKVALCDESKDIDNIFTKNEILKEIYVSKQEILFCLDDILIKQKLYSLYKISLNKEDNLYMQDFLELFLDFSISKKCSDIHIETEVNSLIVRLRIDGLLKTFFSFDVKFYSIISSIIKLISKLDITEKRKPQNGRFDSLVNNKKIDFRVSTMPTITGESIVLRILDNLNTKKDLKNIGFDEKRFKSLTKCIRKSNGLILLTGPTGSGKTTTLYSILNELNDNSKKIITIEDPIEYQIKGIQQVAVNENIGLKFNDVLKNILRQDPDIIMIGEIRDKESLNIAIQASLTGHLVFSTLHTNDSISTLNRLYDLSAKPFLIASTLRAVISQRLVLKLCPHCTHGCSVCNFTKFSGRIPLFEFLEIDEKIASLISSKADNQDILELAMKSGFKTLLEDANEKVENNLTTITEIYKVIF